MTEKHTSGPPVLAFDSVSFRFDERPLFDNVNISIQERSLVGIVGPNGGGKTTLLKLALGLLKPHKGTIRVLGMPPEEARRQVGYVPQHFNFDDNFPATVEDVVLMGRMGHRRSWGFYNRMDRKLAMEGLEEVEMDSFWKTPFSSLSGGQKQRVLIARALTTQADVLMLDEPTANVDPATQRELYELLTRLAEKRAVLLVTHDMNFVAGGIKKVLCVNQRVVMHDTEEVPEGLLGQMLGTELRFVKHGHGERDDEH